MNKRIVMIAFKYLPLLLFPIFSVNPLQAQKDNALSPKEKQEGWVLLFDGTSTNNWRPYKNKASDGWKIENGELINKKDGVKNRADMITKEEYDSFEFVIDWKVDKGANSGIVYHANEKNNSSYESGPEYQLIDDKGYPQALEDWQKSGADYDMHPPTKVVSKPAGEYNHTRIVVKGAHVEHWLNGEKVADFDFWTPEWNALKAKSKFKDNKEWGMAKKGYIALQDHGGGISFKNIKIKKL